MMQRFVECREAVVAGQFYAGSPSRLKGDVEDCLSGARGRKDRLIRAMIVPHAGYQYSGPTAGQVFGLLRGVQEIKRVVVMAPSHHVSFKGVSIGNYGRFVTPLGVLDVDAEACQALADGCPLISVREDAHAYEHALEVQLPFIQTILPDVMLVPIVCGQLNLSEIRQVGDVLRAQLLDDSTLWVVSSDFTHFGYSFGYVPFEQNVQERLKELDMGAVDCISRLSMEEFVTYVEDTGATICGRMPIALLLQMLGADQERWDSELVHYTTSGALTHDDAHSVSYVGMVFRDHRQAESDIGEEVDYLSDADKEGLLELARNAIQAHVHGRPLPEPEIADLSSALRKPAASFVSLHVGGNLRGCIGSLQAVEPLYQDVIRNACNAAFRDPRFPPVSASEEPLLELEISVLTAPVPISGPDDFVVGKHGIIFQKGPYHSVFLPQVAPQQGWDRETTLNHLALKAGLRAGDWRQGASFSVFEAIVFD